MRPFPVFVIGMHRSGTTLLTRILSELGLFMGRHRDTNEETHLLINVNEQMLHRAGANWDHPASVLESMRPETFGATYQQFQRHLSIPELVFFLGQDRYSACNGNLAAITEIWGAKDPRLTYTLPLWHRLLPNMKIIHIMRHGVDVAASLQHRHRKLVDTLFTQKGKPIPSIEEPFWTGIVRHTTGCLDLMHGLKLWADHVEMAQRHVAHFKERALELRYEDLLEKPAKSLSLITEFLEIAKAPTLLKSIESLNKERLYGYRKNQNLQQFAAQHEEALKKFLYHA